MKRSILFLLFSFIIIMIISCNDDAIDSNHDEEDISPQQDIRWTSLANTGWPMNHGNPQSNGRSSYSGPKLGILNSKISYHGIESSLAIGKAGELLITSNYYPQRISALNQCGNVIWQNEAAGNIATTPLVAEGIIYCADASGLYAIGLDGIKKWKYDKDCSIWNIGINIGLDGTVYCVTKQNILKAISSEGILLWELKDQRFRADEHGAPTFSPDGKTLYIQGNSISIIAVDIENHNVKWIFGEHELLSSPVIDSQGNIYFIPEGQNKTETKKLYSINSSGNLLWTFDFDDDYILDNTEPTIDYNGNIYFGGSTLYSVNYKGKLRWKSKLGNQTIISPLVSDVKGNIFIATANLSTVSYLTLFSFNMDGRLNWKINIQDERLFGASPAITKNGQLIVPTFRASNILIIN